jgi:hypothetical protein
MKYIPSLATALSILTLSLAPGTTVVQEPTKAASSAETEEKVDWVVACESGLIEVKEPPKAPNGTAPAEVSYAQLEVLSKKLHGLVLNYKTKSADEAKEAFVQHVTAFKEFQMDVIGGKKNTAFTAHPDLSIPSDRLWIIRPGAEFAHILTLESREVKPKDFMDAENRKVAYATQTKSESEGGGLRYFVVCAPVLAFKRSDIPNAVEIK